MINVQEIDHLTEKFYQSICFDKEKYPDVDSLQELFYGAGKLINNNFDIPMDFTVQSFSQALMQQINDGNADFFVQQEISDITEVFGKIAQRISIYEYNFHKDRLKEWPRGVNYIQYACIGGKWLITSMLWSDAKKGLSIPERYLDIA